MKDIRVGFALCGSFCTFSQVLTQMEHLVQKGAQLYPILSNAAASYDTRFGQAEEIRSRIEAICGRPIIDSIPKAEPIGPKQLLDLLIIEPCTGNTLGKLAAGITDTPVTMATKAHLRNGRPVLIAVSTNDALSASAKNIGTLLNTKNIYFVPMKQDNPTAKPTSLVALFDQTEAAAKAALDGYQLQPLLP